MSEQLAQSTDREIWRETPGDLCSPSIHVTERGGIGIDVGGRVVVKSAQGWHALACHPETLSGWFTEDDMEAAKNIIGDCPSEILQMVAALVTLDITTRNHAGNLAADGRVFRSEAAIDRADAYRESINALVGVWGAPEFDEDEEPPTGAECCGGCHRKPCRCAKRTWMQWLKSFVQH